MEKVYNGIESVNLSLLHATKSWPSWKDEKKITYFWIAIFTTLLMLVCGAGGYFIVPTAVPVVTTTAKPTSVSTTTASYWDSKSDSAIQNPAVD